MSNVYFTADLHLNHDFVARTRSYADADDHDNDLVARWNQRVTKRDQVWILGDLGMGSLTEVLSRAAALNGIKHLVFGNHDPGHPMHRGAHNKQRRYLDVFESAQMAGQLRIDKRKVNMSHFPYVGDHQEEDRHDEWRLRRSGMPLLCGHVHHEWETRGPQFNVGLDHNPNLVSHEQVRQWLATI